MSDDAAGSPARVRTEIVPARRGIIGSLRDVATFRDLLVTLAVREIKVRYKQTAFGALWAMLQPLLLMIVFTVILGHLGHLPSSGQPYALVTLCALVPWTFFAQVVSTASHSLVGNASMLSKVYFPRLIVPLSGALAHLVDLLASLIVLAAVLVYYGTPPRLSYLAVPLLIILALVVASAVGIFFAAVNVRYRDVQYAVPFLIQIWLFATPVAYAFELIPAKWHTIVGLNPMVTVCEGFRTALLGLPLPTSTVVISVATSVVGLAIAVLYFSRVEQTFADIV